MTAALWRRALAEYVGTALLVAIVVGSGIMAQRLSPDDIGMQLLQNSLATALGLGVLIAVLGPISGAHFNPVVTFALRTPVRDALPYVGAQILGGISGAILANVMFDLAALQVASTDRTGANLLVSEVVATAGLVLVILALVRTGRLGFVPAAVGAYIGAAYWFTSSTSFANPAVTIGRVFSDTFAGIAPGSVPGFVAAQIIGGALAVALAAALFPTTGRETPTNEEQQERAYV